MTGSSYQNFILARSHRNPCTGGLIDHFKSPGTKEKPSTIVSIAYPPNADPLVSPLCHILEDGGDLPQLLRDQSTGCGRILIVEDIQLDDINILGETLDIDPFYFAGHISTDVRNIEKTPAPPSAAVFPSQIAQSGFLHLHYQQVVDLGSSNLWEHSPYNLKSDTNVPRNVRRLPPLSGRQLGLARGCISAVVKRFKDSWICLILCDPPIKNFVEIQGSDDQTRRTAKPLNGGFEDFLNTPLDPSETSIDKSVLGSLVRYFRNQSPPGFEQSQPTILSLGYYPTRIALAEWNIYIRLMGRYFKYYEYTIQDNETRLHNNDIVDLQRWRRRTLQSQNKLALLATFIEHWLPEEAEKPAWEAALKDIKYIRSQLKETHSSFEQIIPVLASMVQLLDSRRAISQAASVARLTFIAMVFVPLSWVASLFSMAEGYSPGQDKFWVYFVTALPVLGVALLGSTVKWAQVVVQLKGVGEMFSWQVWNKKRQTAAGSV
ncbi:hypothetical protein QBC44DRAFT_391713 [Cladorrhinum sp. PSN332]|nr:hypothetical protein QBC44DRAFT_391713 [Cladorrhinum sp. PSN332]